MSLYGKDQERIWGEIQSGDSQSKGRFDTGAKLAGLGERDGEVTDWD